ncbi:MAG: flippase-like domain-containing protein [Candidatus Aminicenantes bacterium]|nr:flippase-like domain-containing protein [Candidatus Aminicenantes bacterium]
MLKNKVVYVALSAAVSAVLLWLLFSQIETQDVLETFSRIYVPAAIVYMIVALAGAWLRAWRYKLLLLPQKITWGHILLVTFIRNSLIDLLPARIGSLSYIYVLNRRLEFPFEAAASTFVVCFLLDFLTLSPFLVVAVVAVGIGATTVSASALLWVALLFFLIVFLVFWQIRPVASLGVRLLERLAALLKVEDRRGVRLAVEKLRLTIDSLALIQKRKIYLPIFVLSLFIRLAKYVSVFSLFFGLLRSHGYSLGELSFWTFILGISGAELTSALPVKGLAGFGTWESAWALTFRLLRFDPALAIVSGIGVHLLTNVFEYSLGIASILILAWPFLRKRKKHDPV